MAGPRVSPAFVRAPEGNGCAERFIRTLKENLLWVRNFDTIEQLRQALLKFREVYNITWLIERHGYLTPNQFRQKQLQPIAAAQDAVSHKLRALPTNSDMIIGRNTMNRRSILTGAAASAAGMTLLRSVSQAQQANKIYRIGVLLNRKSPSPETESLRTGLTQLGYIEGTNIVYEVRPAEGQLDRLPGFAAELVSMGIDIIVSYGGPPTNAAQKATTTIPIVFTLVADPVAIGAAVTLERPGGNLTGVTTNDPELPVQQMALLKGIIPKLTRVAIFSDADIPGADDSGLAPIDRTNAVAAHAAGLTPQVLKLRGPKPDFDAAFKAMASEDAEALVALEVPSVFAVPKTVAELATARRIPTMLWGGQGEAGGLISYGTSYTETYRRVPVYVDRILKGAKPAETPIEVFSNHQLVINLKTARELGLTVPADLLNRADRVIG